MKPFLTSSKLIKLYKEGKDIHLEQAVKIHGLHRSEITPEQRQLAKVVNLRIFWAAGITNLKKARP